MSSFGPSGVKIAVLFTAAVILLSVPSLGCSGGGALPADPDNASGDGGAQPAGSDAASGGDGGAQPTEPDTAGGSAQSATGSAAAKDNTADQPGGPDNAAAGLTPGPTWQPAPLPTATATTPP